MVQRTSSGDTLITLQTCLCCTTGATMSQGRAAKCPYKLLLDHHCPMTPQVAAQQHGGGAKITGNAAAATAVDAHAGRSTGSPSQAAQLHDVQQQQQQQQEGDTDMCDVGLCSPVPMTGLSGSLQSQDIQCGQGSWGAKGTQGSGNQHRNSSRPAQQNATVAAGSFAVPAEVKRMRLDRLCQGLDREQLLQAGDVSESEGVGPAGVGCPAQDAAAAGAGLLTSVCPAQGLQQQWSSQGQHRSQQQQHNSSQQTQLHQTQQEACLAAAVVPHSAVVSYVWSVVRHVVPAALLGSRHNRQVGGPDGGFGLQSCIA
jgi:hypothetical protein